MDIQIINLCPHEINIKDANGKLWNLPPSEAPARVQTDFYPSFYIGAIGVFTKRFIDNIDLLPATHGTMYIVSRQVATSNPNRRDLMVPGATYTEGSITYCVGLEIIERRC